MARAIAQVRAGVVAALAAQSDTAGHDEGAEKLKTHEAPPFYFWVPGPARPVEQTQKTANSTTLVTMRAVVNVHCWGVDRDDAYRLAENLISAFRGCVAASGRVLGIDWPEHTDHSNKGNIAIVSLAVDEPIRRGYNGVSVDEAEVTITGAQQTAEIHNTDKTEEIVSDLVAF